MITQMKYKFISWLCKTITGFTPLELEEINDNASAKSAENSDYISRSDFDPDDYDFEPLRDYDFSEFLTSETVDDQIECFLSNNNYCTTDWIETEYVQFETYESVVNELRNKITELEAKVNKPKKSRKKKKSS